MLQLSFTQKPASHDRQNGSKRCHGKGDFGMKVAMIGHKDFPSRSGGVEVMVGGLATSLVRRGYDVTVYNRGLQKGHNIYTTEGVQARRIFTFQKASLNAMVYSFLATFDALTRDCDVIHYHAIGPSVPLVIAKLFGKHTVCTVHGLNWKVDKWGGFASAYLKLGERVAAKYADDLVVLSESEWNYFQEKYDRTAILIPNAVQMRQPLPCNLIREKYGLEAGSYILYVGRISPEKGPLDLVEGYLKAHTDKKLVLAGPFAETEYCTTVQEKIAGNPNIITTGYVVGDALLELYSNCALFVLPSHTEGLSLSLLEALSLGVKCLVSDIPENTTVTADYGTEFRTEDTDSLGRALERDTARPLTPEQSKAQLDYVRAQTCPDWEAILVDDGSPDGCGALCDAAARQDARFRVIHQKNAGVGAARNAGLAAARGTYVQFLDSDDALEPQMVEVLCRTARQTDADLIMFGGYEEHYAADGTRTGCTDIAPVLEGVYRGDPCPQLFPQLSAMSLVTRQLFRRRCIEEGNCRFTDYKIAEDALFFVSFYRQHLHCVVGIPEKLYRYKLRASGSASQSYHPERLADNFYLSDAVEAVARDWGLNDDPACRRAVNHSRVLDLQLGIKNVCLGPLSFRQRTAWLRQALRIPAVRAAVRDMPLQDARSRNDRIKLALLKMRLCAVVVALSSWNNRR